MVGLVLVLLEVLNGDGGGIGGVGVGSCCVGSDIGEEDGVGFG